jgi:hypothetical protein
VQALTRRLTELTKQCHAGHQRLAKVPFSSSFLSPRLILSFIAYLESRPFLCDCASQLKKSVEDVDSRIAEEQMLIKSLRTPVKDDKSPSQAAVRHASLLCSDACACTSL